MSSVPLHYVDLRAFSYVTEDEQRVADALALFLPDEFEVDRVESEGHYGDPIVVLSARVESGRALDAVLEGVAALPASARERVAGELDERVDEDCSFYLSFDKQAAANGTVQLGEGIAFRAKVESYPAKRERAIEAIESAGVL
jgi:RNA binding exosome subunit